MRYGEYRTSFDIDFMVADLDGYRELRERVRLGGLLALVKPESQDAIAVSPARADQYGIRGHLGVANTELKFEIVHEARISFDEPAQSDQVVNVTSLSSVDLVAEKLLANSDRWADTGVFNRDVIDLAFMQIPELRLHPGFDKATAAYGDSVKRDLDSAITKLSDDPRWLERCIDFLQIDAPQAVVLKRIRALHSER